MNYWLLIIPVISAFIGWITNWVAIKMLFHPRNPINILGIQVQGIFPKRQQQFAEKLGKIISNDLSVSEHLRHVFANGQQRQRQIAALELALLEPAHFLLNHAAKGSFE